MVDKNELGVMGIKDMIKEFKPELIMAFVCIIVGVGANMHIGCGYEIVDDMWVYGNCGELKEYVNNKQWLEMDEKLKYDEWTPETVENTVGVDFVIEMSLPVATTTTTTTNMPCITKVCPPQRDCVCKCDICTKCPTPQYEFTAEQVKWMLNYKPRFGMSGYQSGGWDAKDDWLEYLQVEGRPKFKSRPSPTGWSETLKSKNESTYCFTNLGNHFYLNRTPDENDRKRWSWSDSQCKNSYLRINHL